MKLVKRSDEPFDRVKYNTEELTEVFAYDHDVEFRYGEKTYFFTYFEDACGKMRRAMRDGLEGPVLTFFDIPPTIDTPVLGGRSFRELIPDIQLLSIY